MKGAPLIVLNADGRIANLTNTSYKLGNLEAEEDAKRKLRWIKKVEMDINYKSVNSNPYWLWDKIDKKKNYKKN